MSSEGDSGADSSDISVRNNAQRAGHYRIESLQEESDSENEFDQSQIHLSRTRARARDDTPDAQSRQLRVRQRTDQETQLDHFIGGEHTPPNTGDRGSNSCSTPHQYRRSPRLSQDSSQNNSVLTTPATSIRLSASTPGIATVRNNLLLSVTSCVNYVINTRMDQNPPMGRST